MKYLLTISVVVSLLMSCHQQSAELLKQEFDVIIKHWLPDSRIGICNFKLVKGADGRMTLTGESMFPEAKKEVLELLSGKGINFTDSVVILPDTTRIVGNWGLITLSIANLRGKPAHSSELISQAIMGTPVRVLKDGDGWILIQTPDRYIGWTNKTAVQQFNRTAFSEWRNAERLIYTGIDGNIYADTQKTMMLSDLVTGAILVGKSENKDINKVTLPDGRVGFTSKQNWCSFNQWKDTTSLAGDQMIRFGKMFMGFPYLWGGTSSKAMDCSGFVKTVSFLNGAILERDASQQYKHGVEVNISSGWEKLSKGDLLFFGSKSPLRITHVAIYIGDRKFIHSSGSIHINSLDSNNPDYNSELITKLVGARRIVGLAPEPGCLPVKLHNWY